MDRDQKRTYTLDFKKSSAKLAAESEQPVAQTARDLGININTLHGWIDKYYPKAKQTEKPLKPELEEGPVSRFVSPAATCSSNIQSYANSSSSILSSS